MIGKTNNGLFLAMIESELLNNSQLLRNLLISFMAFPLSVMIFVSPLRFDEELAKIHYHEALQDLAPPRTLSSTILVAVRICELPTPLENIILR